MQRRQGRLVDDRQRAAVGRGSLDDVAEERRRGQGTRRVVDHHHVGLTTLDRGAQRAQRSPLRLVPGRTTGHDRDRGVGQLACERRAHRLLVALADDQHHVADVRQRRGPPDRPGEHPAPGEREQHLVGVVPDPTPLAGRQHHQRRTR